jgi:hypothetical protein
MKEKYKRRIRQFAEQSLERQIRDQIEPTMGFPSEIQDLIKKEVFNAPIPDEACLQSAKSIGSQLQVEGRAIAAQLFDQIFEQTIPFIEQEKNKRKAEFERNRIRAIQSTEHLESLKKRVETGSIERVGYWRGADVMIVTQRIPEEHLAWSHTDDIQVVTGNDELTGALAWVFTQLRDILIPFLDYQNKYEFYGELAKAAIKVIDSGDPFREVAVLNAVISRAEVFQVKWLKHGPYFEN